MSDEFMVFCEDQGIHRPLTAPYTPEQNGVVERKNRTVMEMARSMLNGKKLPDAYWREAVCTAVHILNISPSKTLDGVTPFEECYACWDWDIKTDKPNAHTFEISESSEGDIPEPKSRKHDTEDSDSRSAHSDSRSIGSRGENSDGTPPRVRKFRSLADMHASCSYAFFSADPSSFEEAEKSVDWRKAMLEEINAIKKNSTTGGCFKFGTRLISWESKKQKYVALSSCEAEYMAITAAASQAMWLRKLLKEMNLMNKEGSCD